MMTFLTERMKHRLILLLELGLLTLLLAACNGEAVRNDTVAPDQQFEGQGSPLAETAESIAALQISPTPPGVQAIVWNELTRELSRQLRARERSASTPPQDEASRAVLSFDSTTANLRWGHYMKGDYDQNGLVTISDLTPLGIHFGKSSAEPGDPFNKESIESIVDGDSNGLINIADVTPIGQNFGRRVEGYRLYSSANINDWPEEPADSNGPGASVVAELPLNQANDEPQLRRSFSQPVVPPATTRLYWVRPYDADGEGSASVPLALGPESGNFAPVAVLDIEPGGGLVPLAARLQAFFSADIDGNIVEYEWDLDGPVGGENWVSSGTVAFLDHTFAAAGSYLVTLRVTDDDGATDIDQFPLKVRTAIPPVALLNAAPLSGDAVLHVQLTAAGSLDPDGWIADFGWDWDADGVADYSSGLGESAEFYFYEPGEYSLSLIATDNDGLSTTVSQQFTVQPGQGWHKSLIQQYDWDRLAHTGESPIHYRTSLLNLNGSPALAYYTLPEGPGPGSDPPRAIFQRATDSKGENWELPREVFQGDFDYTRPPQVGAVLGAPAVVLDVRRGFVEPNDFRAMYYRSSSAAGLDWDAGVEVDRHTAISPILLCDGQPSFLLEYFGFVRATDIVGETWDAPLSFDPLVPDVSDKLQLVGGRPAVLFSAGSLGKPYYLAAQDDAGSQWPQLPQLVDSVQEQSEGHMLLDAAGLPGVVYLGTDFRRLMYTRALDPAGNAWSAPQIIDHWIGPSPRFAATIGGRPAVIYSSFVDGRALYVAANNAEGTSWSLPLDIELDGAPLHVNFVGQLVDIAGQPAFSSMDSEEYEPDKFLYYLNYFAFH
jgi:PKD repeat protein